MPAPMSETEQRSARQIGKDIRGETISEGEESKKVYSDELRLPFKNPFGRWLYRNAKKLATPKGT